jgi:hypothetical protein
MPRALIAFHATDNSTGASTAFSGLVIANYGTQNTS